MLKSQRAVIHICGGQMWRHLSTGYEDVFAARGASTWPAGAARCGAGPPPDDLRLAHSERTKTDIREASDLYPSYKTQTLPREAETFPTAAPNAHRPHHTSMLNPISRKL